MLDKPQFLAPLQQQCRCLERKNTLAFIFIMQQSTDQMVLRYGIWRMLARIERKLAELEVFVQKKPLYIERELEIDHNKHRGARWLQST